MTSVEVKSTDVIKLILQFLKQNNLHDSFDTLQRQSKITLNTVNTNRFISSIMQDKWDEVLLMLNSLMLNEQHLFNVYELIIDDLLEHDRYQASEFIIKTLMRRNIKNTSNFRERLMRMEYIIENPQQKALHKKIVTEHRKKEVIKQCLFDIHEEVQSNRLLKLLTEAIKYQSHEGAIKPSIKLNLFEGKQKLVQQQQETIIKSIQKVIKYPEDAKINAMTLSWGEEYLALGGFDGLIEIYNTIDYTYHTGLKFQAEGTALYHDHPVTIMEFNHSDQMLVSADTTGTVKIWNLQTGKLLRKIQPETAVSSVCWGMDPSHLLIGYQDIKLYGVRSCLVLKEYNVGTGDYLNRILVSQNKIYAVTNSGTVKIFNYATQEELISTNIRQAVINVLPVYTSRSGSTLHRLLISTAKRIFQLSASGQEQNKFAVEVGELVNSACVGEYLYEFIRVDDKTCKLNIVSRSTGKNVYYCAIDNEVALCCMQRCKNLMITYDEKNQLNFWRQTN